MYTRWAEKKTNNQLLTKFNKQMEKTWSSSLLYILIIKLKDSSGILNRQFSWSVKIIKFASKKNPKKNCTPGSVGSVLRTFPEDCKYIIDEYNSIKELQAPLHSHSETKKTTPIIPKSAKIKIWQICSGLTSKWTHLIRKNKYSINCATNRFFNIVKSLQNHFLKELWSLN